MIRTPFLRSAQGLLLAAALGLLPSHASEAPKAWDDWAKWAHAQHSVFDDQGHGPDIGSDEWAMALGRQLGVIDADDHGPDPKSEEWKAAVVKKLAAKKLAAKKPAGEDRKLLSAHDAEARFSGLSDHQCRGRTSLCPDRCGHSGKLATFTIVKYLDYQKPGEFGDPKQEEFSLLVVDNRKAPKIPAGMLKAIQALEPGDLVRLRWNHDFVTRDGASFPERAITGLDPIVR